MYNITVVKNIIVNLKLTEVRIDPKCSHHKKRKEKENGNYVRKWLTISLFAMKTSQCICILNHQVVHLKYTQF